MTALKKPPSIDTLRYAQKLEDAGLDRGAANAMARALNEELVDRLLTKADIAEALAPVNAKLADLAQAFEPIHVKLAEIDQRFNAVDAKFDAVDAKFDGMDAKFEALDAKFDGMDAKFEALDAKIDVKYGALDAKIDTKCDALDAKIDVKFDALDAKIDVKFDAVDAKINSLSTKMLFGFSMVFLVLSALVALGVFQFVRSAPPAAPAPAAVALEQPSEPLSGAAALPPSGSLRTPEATWRGERGLR